ncbi:MAG TPA: anti-sigma factor domain-containing protein [Syntrophomonas sp.]|nr:anti-sigma factor domain-containing protein [Syntrophomonas sp.]
MKNEIKGLVMEIEQNHCIIMTHAGEFRRIDKPPGQVAVGQEITAHANTWIDRLRPLALVASLLLMVAVAWSVYQWNQPTVVAYVSLDINPSLELGIDSKSLVIEANGLNEDGQKLLQVKPVIGKDIYTAMSELVTAAIDEQYINTQKENLVFTAIELEPKAPSHVVEEKQIYQAINKSLESAKQPAKVEVTEAQAEARQAAHKLGVSMGRYLLIKEEIKEDKNIRPQDLVNKSLNELGAKQWIEKNQRQKENKKTSLQGWQPQVLGSQWTWFQWDKGTQTQQMPALWTQWNVNNKQMQSPSVLWSQWNKDKKQTQQQPSVLWPQWNGNKQQVQQPPVLLPQWNENKKQIQQQPVLWPQWNGTIQERPAKIKPKTEDKDSEVKDRRNDNGNSDKQNQSVNKARPGKSNEGWNKSYPGRTNTKPGQTDNVHKKNYRRNGWNNSV